MVEVGLDPMGQDPAESGLDPVGQDLLALVVVGVELGDPVVLKVLLGEMDMIGGDGCCCLGRGSLNLKLLEYQERNLFQLCF